MPIMGMIIALVILALSADTLLVDANVAQRSLSLDQLKEGLEASRQLITELKAFEVETFTKDSNHGLTPPSTFNKPFFPEALAQSNQASVELIARQYLSEKYNIPANEINFSRMADSGQSRISSLPPSPQCDPKYLYRSFDGTCNNLNNPRFGQAGTIYQRLMGPANYADGVSKIRLSASGDALPSARLITTTVTVNESVSDTDASLITMQWGQFLDHDLTQTPVAKTNAGAEIKCCAESPFMFIGNVNQNLHRECLPISVPSDDPIYNNINCIKLVRDLFGLNLNGTTPMSREQINALTHWIDGSQIYGSSDAQAEMLRDRSSGKGLLKVSKQGNRTLLPLANECCPGDSTNSCADAYSCFFAGDTRVREQPLLAIMHTLWVREHNRVAKKIFKQFENPKTDEFYFQEARRIVVAEFQHIIYNEYLPVLLGLELAKSVLSVPYSGLANPAVFNEFGAAAYRMGHSQLRSFIRLYEADGSRSPQSYLLGNSFNTGVFRLLNPTFIDNALRGLLQTPAQSVNECFPDDITSQLFRTPGITQFDGDLISINMQRGRDHGLPSYVQARQIALGSPQPTSFDDLRTTHSAEVIIHLKKVYASVKDIDLYIGGVTEKHITGAHVGPTFGYIIAEQFKNLKRSDRFFYNNVGQSVSFTSKQLEEIQKTSLASIICANSDRSITTIQENAFRNPSESNPIISCDDVMGINFNQFY